MHGLFAHAVDNRNKNIASINYTVYNIIPWYKFDQGCLITVQLHFEISA